MMAATNPFNAGSFFKLAAMRGDVNQRSDQAKATRFVGVSELGLDWVHASVVSLVP